MTRTGRSRLAEWFWRAVLCLLSTSVTLLMLELAARVAIDGPTPDLKPAERLRAEVLRPSTVEKLPYELVPGAQGRAWEAPVSINSLGLRGPEPSADPRSRCIVAALGDSVTFGIYLPWEDTWPALLQDDLQRRGTDAEVLNMGVVGYDAVEVMALLESRLDQIQPDVVVWAYCLNDVGIVRGFLRHVLRTYALQRSPWFRSALFRYLYDRLNRHQLAQETQLRNDLSVFAEHYRDYLLPLGADDQEIRDLMAQAPARYPGAWYRDEVRIERLRFVLRELGALARERRFAVALLVVPWLEDVAEDGYRYRAAHTIVEDQARHFGIDVIDVTQPFLDAPAASLRSRPLDPVHPNRQGQSLIARAVDVYLRDHDLCLDHRPRSEAP